MPEGFRRVVRRASAATLLAVGGAFAGATCGRACSSTAAALLTIAPSPISRGCSVENFPMGKGP